ARVAADEVQLRDRHVELVAFRVFDREEFAALAADVEFEQSLIAPDAVIDVHDRRADRELAKVADDRFRIARGAFAAAALLCAFAEELAFGEDRERGFGDREACFETGYGDGEAGCGVRGMHARSRVILHCLIPAKAGIHVRFRRSIRSRWVPAFA